VPARTDKRTQIAAIVVHAGFGSGGTTFVARNFILPTESKCSPWSGYTKTASTVILITSGTSCLSSDSKALTVSVSSQTELALSKCISMPTHFVRVTSVCRGFPVVDSRMNHIRAGCMLST
jgi:hypothetical protein